MKLVQIPPAATPPRSTMPAMPASTPKADQSDALAAALRAALDGAGLRREEVENIIDQKLANHTGPLDEHRVREIASEIASQHVNRVQVVSTDSDKDGPTIEGAHTYLPVALKVVSAGIPLLLYGAKGCGKTTLAEQLASSLELNFAHISCSKAMTAGKLVGFANPMNGSWLRGELTRHLETATLVLVDEADAADPGVQICMNSILANRYIGEPQGLVRAHERFVAVFATNTMNGATREYNAREKLDGALLDRVAVLELHLDNAIEARMCGVIEKSTLDGNPVKGGLYKIAADWLSDVRAARATLQKRGMTAAMPSPRAAEYGAKLIKHLGRHWLRELFLFRGASVDVRNILEEEFNKQY